MIKASAPEAKSVDDVARIIYRELGGRKGDEGWHKFLQNFKRHRPRGREMVTAWLELHEDET